MSQDLEAAIQVAAGIVAQADGILFTAGAGLGVDSGLPDFRGTQGLWKAYPALAGKPQDYSALASRPALHNDPEGAWGFWGHSLDLYRRAVPHEGFSIMRKWGERAPRGYFVFTSNVDGQYQKAGFDQASIHEVHGSIHWVQCTSWRCERVGSAEAIAPSLDRTNCRWLGALPRCSCGELLRPNVFMFLDGPNWREARYKEQEARMRAWLKTVTRLAIVEVGAGGAVPTVRMHGEKIAAAQRARMVRINPKLDRVPQPADVGLKIGGKDGLRLIDAVM
jgi:NAD-dependent SIR2 family protein deacetylase